MYKNIIWDFDGVIINSHDVQRKALTEAYFSVCGNATPPYEEFFNLSGNSLKNIFTELKLPLDMIPIYQNISRKNIDLIKVHNGMIELLYQLNQKGYNCALCTGKERSRTIEILNYFNLKRFFKVIICSDDVIEPKPHPESIKLIMEILHASKDNTIMIGDGINDIAAARNAGIKVIAVSWGDVSKKLLSIEKPTHMVDSIYELRKLLFKVQLECKCQ